jgi:hypothetical protein
LLHTIWKKKSKSTLTFHGGHRPFRRRDLEGKPAKFTARNKNFIVTIIQNKSMASRKTWNGNFIIVVANDWGVPGASSLPSAPKKEGVEWNLE